VEICQRNGEDEGVNVGIQMVKQMTPIA